MKLSLQLALGALIAIAISSCWVDRKTAGYSCVNDNDCLGSMPSRVCDTDIGYCVLGENPNACPSICNGACDMVAKTCTIDCLDAATCMGNTTCPDGFDCTINCGMNGCNFVECNGDSECRITCTGNNACNNIDCGDGGTCTVVCTGNNACDNVDCNGARCNVTCTSNNACDNVDCDNACRCDVTCMEGQSCSSRSCSAVECESPQGCVSTQMGCPATCN